MITKNINTAAVDYIFRVFVSSEKRVNTGTHLD